MRAARQFIPACAGNIPNNLDVDARTQWRLEQAQPLLDSMHDWLSQTRVMVADGGGLAKAIDYSLKRWPALSRYATDGRFPIDNNPVENMIRPIAIGRRNWGWARCPRQDEGADRMTRWCGDEQRIVPMTRPTIWYGRRSGAGLGPIVRGC